MTSAPMAQVRRGAQGRGVEWLGRAGLLAQGISYGIVGWLALQLAFGHGGAATSRQGALKTLADDAGGTILLIALAIGFAGYAIWRFAQALFGRDRRGKKPGFFKRASSFAKGALYTGLAVATVGILVGSGSGSGSSSGGGGEQKATAGVLGWSHGKEIVIAGGVGVCIAALYQFFRAFTRRFMKDMDTSEMRDRAQRWIERLGIAGLCARGIVFGIIGWFLIKAARDFDPNKAIGLGGALAKLAHQSYGPVLLGVTAAGLIAFAVFCVAQARYRQV